MSDWIGRTLSKVEIQKLIGRGGMAEVYLGRHTTLDRLVAVKILFGHLSDDSDLLSRFEREADAKAAYRHAQYMADMFVRAPGGSAPPATAGTAAPSGEAYTP